MPDDHDLNPLVTLQRHMPSEAYVDFIWLERERLQPVLKPSSAWPFVRMADLPMARITFLRRP